MRRVSIVSSTPALEFSRHLVGRSLVIMALVAARIIAATPVAATQELRPTPRYAGESLVDVLQDLNRRGLRIVFSTVLVPPRLRVVDEPAGPTPREVLDQVLKPHGLEVRTGPRGTLIVARAPRARLKPPPPVAVPGTVRGRVVDADSGEPLAGVLVVAQEAGRRATTEADGSFAIEALPPGRVVLYVSVVGYGLARPAVDVAGGGIVDLVVPLAAGTGAYTEQLTVRGEPAASLSAAPTQFVLGSAELQELRGVLADDPFRAMQTMPGVATGDDFRAEFSVRGSDVRQMGFSLDGVAAPWLVHSVRAVEDTGTIAMINGDVLERVALASGAGPQLFGNRTGAWVDSTMREGSRDAIRFSGSVSGTGASIVGEGPLGRNRRGAWLVSGRQSYIDWLIQKLDTQEQTTFGFTDGQAKLVFDLTPRHQLQMTAVAGRSTFDERDDLVSANGVRIGRAATGLVIGAWRATMGSSVVLTQRFAFAGLRFRNTNDFAQELTHGRERVSTYRADLSYAPRDAMTLDVGVALDREAASFRQQQYGGTAGGTPLLRSWVADERLRWRQGGYARVRLTPAPAWIVDGGARVDHEGLHGETLGSPWMLVRWTPVRRWTFSAGAGAAHQVPELSQFPVPATDPPLHAEHARYVDLSGEFRLTDSIRAQAAVYRRDESDGLRLDARVPRLVNGALVVPFASGAWLNRVDTAARGVELMVRRTAANGLVGWVSYAYGRTRSTDQQTGERYWGDFDQRHSLNVHASYRLSARTNASARLRVASNVPVLGYFAEQGGELTLGAERNATRLPTYARLDVRLNRTFNFTRRRLTLFAEVLNVLNRENLGRTDGTVRTNGTVTGYVETLFPLLPSAGLRIEF